MSALQTGIPFNVSTGTDTANTGSSATWRPDLLHTPSDNCGRGHLIGRIDSSAYTVADLSPITTNYAYGNEGTPAKPDLQRAGGDQEENGHELAEP